jgi:hypothetical protein
MMQVGEVDVPTLKDRVTKILTTPKTEWPVIDAEATDVARLYSGYVMILAAIGPIAGFIGSSLLGFGLLRTGIAAGLLGAIVGYAVALAAVYICALIIDKLAPTFDSTPNLIQALKLVAYASTAAWVASAANVIPLLGSLIALIGSLYSVYLLYLGLPVLMKTPEAKVVPYLVVSVVVFIAVFFVGLLITGAMVGTAFVASALAG